MAPTATASSPIDRWRKPPILPSAYISAAFSSNRRISIMSDSNRRARSPSTAGAGAAGGFAFFSAILVTPVTLAVLTVPRASGGRCTDGRDRNALHQLLDERLREVRRHAERTMRQRAALAEDGLELVQRRQILAFPEQPDRDDVAPLVSLVHRGAKVGRIMAEIFQLAGPLLEKLVRVLVVVGHARAERVDEGKPAVRDPALDQLDQMLLLTGESPGHVRRACRDGEGNRVDRVLDAAERRALRVRPLPAGGRELAGRQSRSEEHTSEL